MCYVGLMARVGSGEVTITKLLLEVPDGSFQSGSEWEKKHASHRQNDPY